MTQFSVELTVQGVLLFVEVIGGSQNSGAGKCLELVWVQSVFAVVVLVKDVV